MPGWKRRRNPLEPCRHGAPVHRTPFTAHARAGGAVARFRAAPAWGCSFRASADGTAKYFARPFAVKGSFFSMNRTVSSHHAILRRLLFFFLFKHGAGQSGQNAGNAPNAYGHEQILGNAEKMAESAECAADKNASGDTFADSHASPCPPRRGLFFSMPEGALCAVALCPTSALTTPRSFPIA